MDTDTHPSGIVTVAPLSSDEFREELERSCRRIRQTPLLFVVEGIHDIHFLRRISHNLHQQDAKIVDLSAHEAAGNIVFLPFGGGDVWEWTHRLAPLSAPELHLYDSETGIESTVRLRAAAAVNARPSCRAFLTGKRSLENYLHPAAIEDERGITLDFGDQDNVAELAARSCYERTSTDPVWELLPGRARKRFRERCKHWLNTSVADRMTPQRIKERDGAGEILRWLQTAGQLAGLS